MTVTPSARLGLLLLTDDEDLSPQVPNWQRIDEAIGHIWVADNTQPADIDLFDGAVVHEITSGKAWVARTNGVGGYLKRWIRYPWLAVATTTALSVVNSGWQNGGFTSWGGASIGIVGGGPVNATAADLVTTRLVVPIKGIYSGMISAEWTSNNTGLRAVRANFNNSTPGQDVNTSDIRPAALSSTTNHRAQFKELLPAGTTITADFFQNSGGNLNVSYGIFATLETPVA